MTTGSSHRPARSPSVALTGVIGVLVLLVLATCASAAPTRPTGLLLTLAARVCPSYTDITANKARNNIMESLRDLGPDTPYKDGENVDPDVEAAVQPNCKALPDWRFTLGNSYTSKAVPGPWGVLSVIKGQLREPVVTKDETPLLNARGEATGKQIAGAVTIELGSQEAKLAPWGSLWVQGGTPTDPVLDKLFPGPEYGFGALRCATDNVNGDNVEYAQYPAGSTHIFCFAYYVKPPPTGGTIVIRKQEIGAGAPAETFNFGGNVSYEPGGHFSLAPAAGGAAEETFYRGATSAGGEPWRVTEEDAVDWRLVGIDCTSRDGTSQIATSTGDAEASIDLGAEDLVTCTYTDEYAPPPEGLLIRKITEGGVGAFDFTVKPLGGGTAERATASTEREGVAVDADPSPLDLAPGRYRIVEDLPNDDAGRWVLARVECGGEEMPVEDGGVEVTVNAREAETCTFANRFTPRGEIEISKVTRGGAGTTGFQVESAADPEMTFLSKATTTADGDPAKAEGEPTDHLELGRYTITESPPAPGKGEWELVEVSCDGRVMPFAQGRIELTLTTGDPHRHCTFVNRFHAKDESPLPTPQRPDEGAAADLVVTKDLLTANPEAGEVIEYKVTVTNDGRGDAGAATIVDQPLGPARLVFARPDRGSCGESLPVTCDLGTLVAGKTATLRVGIISPSPGLLLNRAVVGTDSNDQEIAGAHAESPAKVRPSRPTQSPVPGLG
jgi:uncharacterized repeat protein (TIGR01451 family)